MSTKFSPSPNPQQTPAVCRKPPEKLPPQAPPIWIRPLQAYVQYSIPHTPGIIFITGLLPNLVPGPAGFWTGLIVSGNISAQLTIASVAPFEQFTVVLEALVGLLPVDSHTWPDVIPRSAEPFRIGLLTAIGPAPTTIWQCDIAD